MSHSKKSTLKGKPSAVCTMATNNSLSDLKLFIYSLRLFEETIPIYILCDTKTQQGLERFKNDDNILPLQPKPNDIFYIVDLYDGPNNHNESIVTRLLRENGYKVRSFQIDKSDSLIVANHILDQIPSDGLVLLNAYANPVEWKDNIFLPKSP